MDKILIRDLQVEGIIGIHPEERVQRQPLLINLVLYGDTRPAGQSDDINQAMNYQALSQAVIDHVATGAPLLVERLAEEIAVLLFQLTPLAEKVRVRVEKPAALAYTRAVGVEIVRSRNRLTEADLSQLS